MCEPVSIMMALASAQQASAYSRAADAQGEIADNNIKLLDYHIIQKIKSGERQVEQQNQRTADNVAGQRVAISGAGFDVNSGTALDLQVDTAAAGAADAMIIQSGIDQDVFNIQVQQQSLLSQSNLDAANLDAQATSTVLGGGAQAANTYNNNTRKRKSTG